MYVLTELRRKSIQSALLAIVLAAASLAAVPLASAATVAYEYDVRGRLLSVTYPNGTRITYQYDDAGNRISVTVSTT